MGVPCKDPSALVSQARAFRRVPLPPSCKLLFGDFNSLGLRNVKSAYLKDFGGYSPVVEMPLMDSILTACNKTTL